MDVFDEGIGDDVIPEDWAKVERLRRTNGFREGLAAGQEATLQDGFNLGFMEGTEAKFSVSFLKGIISALITSSQKKEHDLGEELAALPVSELEAMVSDLDCLQVEPSLRERSDGVNKDKEAKKRSASSSIKTAGDGDSAQGNEATPSGSASATQLGNSSECKCDEEGQRKSSDATCCQAIGEQACSSNSEAEEKVHKHFQPGRKKDFHSRNKALQEICDKLLPHLARLHCEDVLTDASHPFHSI